MVQHQTAMTLHLSPLPPPPTLVPRNFLLLGAENIRGLCRIGFGNQRPTSGGKGPGRPTGIPGKQKRVLCSNVIARIEGIEGVRRRKNREFSVVNGRHQCGPASMWLAVSHQVRLGITGLAVRRSVCADAPVDIQHGVRPLRLQCSGRLYGLAIAGPRSKSAAANQPGLRYPRSPADVIFCH
jgi:hypothetical protein